MERKERKEGKEERAHLLLQVSPGVQVHPFIYLWAFRSISPHLPNLLCLITLGHGFCWNEVLSSSYPQRLHHPLGVIETISYEECLAPLSSVSSLGEAASPSVPDIVICLRERAESQRVDPGSSHILLHVRVTLSHGMTSWSLSFPFNRKV